MEIHLWWRNNGNINNEHDSLKASIISVNPSIFHGVIADKFQAEQTLSEKLKQLASSLLENDKLLNDIILFHSHCFAALYTECKKGADWFIQFQFQWYNYCSAFLLSREHSVSKIELEELPSAPINITRSSWLSFCETSGVPVPQSNPVIMLVLSAIYEFLLEYSMNFQDSSQKAMMLKKLNGFKNASCHTLVLYRCCWCKIRPNNIVTAGEITP